MVKEVENVSRMKWIVPGVSSQIMVSGVRAIRLVWRRSFAGLSSSLISCAVMFV
jgi:hypothetical protein